MFQKAIGQKTESGRSSVGNSNIDTTASAPPVHQPAAHSPAPSRPSNLSGPSGRNVLSTDVEIKGDIKFSDDLVVDGRIEGSISSDGSLTVGENARIKAAINTRSVVIYGKVHGNIEVTEVIELKANAELVGDVKAASLSIEPGAIFVGASTVGTPSSKHQAPQATAASPSNKPANPSNKPENPSSDNKGKADNKPGTSELPLTDKAPAGNKAVSS